ncbi:MAG: S-layer homology domain-containing protein [Candidatus Obscuribacterales bacterium]|nr:S-layer homology domain-containing protein [Candidatus Obscuribacterales bacterium]
MKRSGKIALAITMAMTLGVSSSRSPAAAQPAWTQNFTQVLVNVNEKLTNIQRSLSDATAQGRLSPQASESFKQELNRIKDTQTQYQADGKLSIWERARLVFEIDNLQRQIDGALGPRPTDSVSSTNLTTRETDLSREISDALFQGRLTKSEADFFLGGLDKVKNMEASYKADGALNPTELASVSVELDNLTKSVRDKIRPLNIGTDSVQTKKLEVQNRIASLKSEGKITTLEADEYAQDLSRIETRENAFRQNDGVLDTNESLNIALELERLSGKLDRFQPMYSQAPGIDARQQTLEKMLGDAFTNGKLTSQQVFELKQEFDRIASVEARYRTDGVLSDTETLTLGRDLDQLKTKLENYVQTSATTASQSGISQMIADARRRFTDAQNSGRLSADNSRDLRTSLDRIDSRQSYMQQDGRLDDSETLTLASDIDRFNSDLGKAVTPLPNVETKKGDIVRKINEGIASSRVKPEVAEDLKSELDRIGQLEATFKSSEGGLSDQEVMALNREYDTLSRRLDGIFTALPDVTAKLNAINSRLSDAAKSGLIADDKRREFEDELARIAEMSRSFKTSDNGLSDWETMTLARDYDRLDADIARALSKGTKIDTAGAPADTQGHWAEQYIAVLSKRGTIGGFPDGTFKPNNFITRAQFAAIVVRALNLPAAGRSANFKDVPQKYWAHTVINQCSDAGLVTGFPDGTYRPEDQVTRTQALVIVAKALQNANADTSVMSRFVDASTVPTWALPSVAKAANAGVLVSYPNPNAIRSSELATRADVAAFVYQTMSKLGEKLPPLRVGLEASGN